MFLKKISKKHIITAIILITILFIYFLISNQQVYGNDQASIEQVIKSIEGYENDSIEILEINDINDDRVVGFLSNHNPAYIQFTKNHNGDYQWNHIEKSSGQSFSEFLINVRNDHSNELKMMIVTTQENEIAKMQLSVNNQVKEQEFSVNQKRVYWRDIPKSKDNNYAFEYKFFDNNGNLLSDN